MTAVDFKAAAPLWLLLIASVVTSLPVNDNTEKKVHLVSGAYSSVQLAHKNSAIDGTIHQEESVVDEEGRKLGTFTGKKDPDFQETDRAFKYSVPVILTDGQVYRDENAPIITRAKRSKKEKKDSDGDENKNKKKKDDKGKDEEDKDDDKEEKKKKKELEESMKEEKRKRKKEQKKAEKKKVDDDSEEDDDESGEEKEEKKTKKEEESTDEDKDKKKKKKKDDDDKEKEKKEKKKELKKYAEDPSREYADLFRR